MSVFKKKYEEANVFKKVIFFLLVVCFLVGIGCNQFYRQVQQTVAEESEHYLKEISNRITSNIKRIIDDNFSALGMMKSVIELNNLNTIEQVNTYLQSQVDLWDFTNIMLIDDTGVAYDLNGKEVSITGDSFLRSFSIDENIVAPTQIINNEEKTVFSSPLTDVIIENKKMVALATLYEPEQFDKILSMNTFDEQAYSYIVNDKGNIAVGSSNDTSNTFGYNVLQTILDSDASLASDVSLLRSNMMEGQGGQFEFSISGTQEYLVYTPVGIENWYLFTFVPVSVVNAQSNLLLQSTLLMSGMIFLVFAIFLIVIIVSFASHRRKLEQIAYVDPLTKGHTIQKFYDLAEASLKESYRYALIFFNIQRFKLLNDQFGRTTCDHILTCSHHGIQSNLDDDECIAHYSADNFVMLIKYENHEDLLKRLLLWDNLGKELGKTVLEVLPVFTVEYGIYIIENNDISIIDMIDRSKLALRNGNIAHKEDDHVRYAYYNDDVRHQLIKEKHIEDIMETALTNHEFEVYLQPKYKTGTEVIAGAEALVRWISKDQGMIYPNDFIPLFEKNGFIIKLDLWMFEQVCKIIQTWKQQGKALIPISVNCSRAHMKDDDFLDMYVKIFKRYDIPAKYLELEFTENMVFEETERLAKIIDDIHEIGFQCSMDDFGSGYSSLNMLQDIHVDTLKLDRIFFKKAFEESNRTKAIISCILDMAQSLKMQTVAEGIEDWEQVDTLSYLGCDLIQGYVYAKPMPLSEFEKLLFEEGKESQHEI